MSRTRRLAEALADAASRLMPGRQVDWARAMAAEQANIEDHRSALAYSAGCLRAAGWERLRSIAPERSWFWPGLAIGALLLLTASIPGSRAWPLFWAPAGGLLTVMTLEQMGGRLSFAGFVLLALKAGLLSALLFLVGTLLLMLAEGEAPSGRFVHFAVISSLMAFVTTVSGAAAAPLVCSPPSAGAPQFERSIDMAIARHPGRTAGLALGLLYLFEALFETGILFAVWPILAGLFAAALLKWDPATGLTPGSGAKAGAKAGLVGGLVLLIVGTPLTYYLMRQFDEEPQVFGVTFDLGPVASLLAMFSLYALGGLLVAAATGALTGLLAGRGPLRRGEPVGR